MNKRVDKVVTKKVIDDKEDREIKEVAYFKNSSQKFLLWALIAIFFLLLGTAIVFINNYYKLKDEYVIKEIVEVKTDKNNILIGNNGEINENITYESFNKQKYLVIEKINTVKFKTNDNSKENGLIKFDVKYDISVNDFIRNGISSNDSDLLVRFSYSYDKEEWKYINNVISTTESTINPLMGNYYDIAGIKTNLNVVTNYEITSEPGKSKTMYWRCETYIKNNQKEDFNHNIKANFKIEYKENA